MDNLTQVYVFYLVLILGISVAIFVMSSRVNKMNYSLAGIVVGVIISYILWMSFGKTYSEKI